jgi:hypothetical protein
MIEFIERLVARWTGTTPKKTYLKLFEQFDAPQVGIVNLPGMLVEFWQRVKPDHFTNGPTPRDMMYIDVETRHASLGELCRLMNLVTGALVQEDDATVMDISKEQFAAVRKMTLDDYFAGADGGSLSFREGVLDLKNAIILHGLGIENLNPTFHSRVMNRMYNDILYITKVIIENMPEE